MFFFLKKKLNILVFFKLKIYKSWKNRKINNLKSKNKLLLQKKFKNKHPWSQI